MRGREYVRLELLRRKYPNKGNVGSKPPLPVVSKPAENYAPRKLFEISQLRSYTARSVAECY